MDNAHTAKAVVGACTEMCPDEEFEFRRKHNLLHKLEGVCLCVLVILFSLFCIVCQRKCVLFQVVSCLLCITFFHPSIYVLSIYVCSNNHKH